MVQSTASNSQKIDGTYTRHTIQAPLVHGIDLGYCSSQVTIRLDTQSQRETMKRLVFALEYEGATLRNGVKVKGAQNAIRWIIERLAEVEVGPPKPKSRAKKGVNGNGNSDA